MEKKMVTVAFDLPGYKVIENIGMVRGIVVRSRNLFSSIGAGLKSLVGGDIHTYKNLCETTREGALLEIMNHAEEMGANAIIGMRYDANQLGSGSTITEVLAYGTAVRVEKID